MRNGSRFYCQNAPIGFNLYDNEGKQRLKPTYQTREEAERECGHHNKSRNHLHILSKLPSLLAAIGHHSKKPCAVSDEKHERPSEVSSILKGLRRFLSSACASRHPYVQ
jgi:hypothetical protein